MENNSTETSSICYQVSVWFDAFCGYKSNSVFFRWFEGTRRKDIKKVVFVYMNVSLGVYCIFLVRNR